jgi:hypothetical protein
MKFGNNQCENIKDIKKSIDFDVKVQFEVEFKDIQSKKTYMLTEFGGRFDPTEKEMASPFEVEVADFIRQNNWILTENIGRFEDKEVIEDIIKGSPVELEKRDENGKKFYYLPPEVSDDTNNKYGRKNRLKAFLEVLLKEKYTFPRRKRRDRKENWSVKIYRNTISLYMIDSVINEITKYHEGA